MLNRILPLRVRIWTKKRDERASKRKQLVENTMNEWVREFRVYDSNNTNDEATVIGRKFEQIV